MKIALVTGGSRGIGLAIVEELSKNGFQIAIVATKNESEYPESTKRLLKSNVQYKWFPGNIAVAADRKKIVDSVIKSFGRIDVLVNNAGVAPKERNDILKMTEESFDFVVGTNTKGNMFMTQAVANQMIKQKLVSGKKGTIINISSCSAEVSSVNRAEYCVSKAGISMLTKLYADRLAADRIFVYEIRPGVIKTDMTSGVKEKYDALIADGLCPIARWGFPEDVARAVKTFCSDDFMYTTGNYIDVDGGFHIRHL